MSESCSREAMAGLNGVVEVVEVTVSMWVEVNASDAVVKP
jgi:hypothetical protein